MEEALDLTKYLPLSCKTRSEDEYIEFLWYAFESNYIADEFEFSNIAFHLLYMSFISFSIRQVQLVREQDFKNALIDFQTSEENRLLDIDTPFKYYENLNESQIFRFLKIIGCENTQLGEFSKLLSRWNKITHPIDAVFFNDRISIDAEIAEMMREVANIQQHMRPIVIDVYQHFLTEKADIKEREHAEPEQEIETSLIHANYISQKDIEVCLAYDLAGIADRPEIDSIRTLHEALKTEYGIGD